uniref:Putative basic region leucine zipper transcription factor n=1 Tax=Amblyomma sculptum TaxID=1581419 RepID=A0A1E1XUF1_AMBSC
MMSTWTVTGMAKNHHCVSVVYRDITQADYEVSGETYNHASPRHASTSSSHLDTGDSSFFFDDLIKPHVGSSDLKESALQSFMPLDDVFLFDLPPHLESLPTALPSPNRMYGGLHQDKVLMPLDKPARETGLSQEYPAATMEMWESNETFQDLSELIQEGKSANAPPPASSQSCYIMQSQPSHRVPASSASITTTATSSNSSSTSHTTWQLQPPPPPLAVASASTTAPAVTVKRPLSPIGEAGPSHSDGSSSPKLLKLEEPQHRYSDMRSKNNMASRRSRMTRKEKELEMEKRASELEQENELLRIKVKNLEELTDRLKKHLISSIVKK